MRAVPTIVGWLAVVALLDLAVGSLMGRGEPPERPADLLLAGPTSAVAADADVDPRVGVPAMGGVSWSEDYWTQFHSLEYEVVPFLPSYQRDSDLPYIHVRDGVRRSYEPDGLGPEAPVVWFFGGSTMWGEGQRDLFTIPSHVARGAEARGVPVRVVNYGERGRTHWEEMLRLERALADEGAPDVVVFYDGVNDLKAQDPTAGGIPSDDPTRFQSSGAFPAAVPAPLSTEVEDPPGTWFEELLAGSFVLQVADRLGLETPASAEDAPTSAQIADRAVSVYRRGRQLSESLAARAGARPLFFWQPLFSNAVEGSPGSLARAQIDRPTIDITRVLDVVPYDSVYLDGAHTNERGAQLVAEAMLPYVLAALGVDDVVPVPESAPPQTVPQPGS